MPLQKSCSLEALDTNIAAEIKAGRPRDQAVAIAHSTLREACRDEGKPVPSAKDRAGIIRKFKRKAGERSVDYLESALASARKVLSHRDYAAIHHAARSRAGGLASGRSRATSIEKSLLLGQRCLSADELADATEHAELRAAADLRLGVNTGGEYLAQLFWEEKARRDAIAKSTADIDFLPDEAFACILPGGFKDSEGKTCPRALRRFAHHNDKVVNGSDNSTVDLDMLRRALSMMDQPDIPENLLRYAKDHLDHHAAALLDESDAAQARKGDPGPSDVHVPGTDWKKSPKISVFKSTAFEQYCARIWPVIEMLFEDRARIDSLRKKAVNDRTPQLVGELEDKSIWIVDFNIIGIKGSMNIVQGSNWMEDPKEVPNRQVWLDAWVLQEMYCFLAFHESGESWLMEHLKLPYLQAHDIINGLERGKRRQAGTITMKTDRSGDPGVMIALRLPPATAKAIAIEDEEKPESMHVTLCYLGRMSKLGASGLMAAAAAIGRVTTTPILRGQLSGVGRFNGTESSDGKDVLVRLVDVPGLTDLRYRLVQELRDQGVDVNATHDYIPHVTLAYVDEAAKMPRRADSVDVYFDSIVLSVNDADTVFPLAQPDPLMEARLQAFEEQLTAPAQVDQVLADGNIGLYAPNVHAGDATVEIVAMSAGDEQLEPGDMVSLSADISGDLHVRRASTLTVAGTIEQVMKSAELAREDVLHSTPVPFVGPEDARIVFVSGAPTELELARMEPLVGEDGLRLAEQYLAPLGIKKSEVALGFACPVIPQCETHEFNLSEDNPKRAYVLAELEKHQGYMQAQLERFPDALVVGLGKAAAHSLGDRALLWLPHPLAARSNENRYGQQITRKIQRIRKCLDDGFVLVENKRVEIVTGRIGDDLASEPGRALAKVAKAAAEKQIVYGVVIDPYTIDTQGEWIPPAVAEEAAHDYLRQSRVIGHEHVRKSGAELVESYCVEYPSEADYQNAMRMMPHRVYERPFGDDVVRSGSWIAGVKLGDKEWAEFKRGEITGFSIGGFSAKTKMDPGSMPKVTVVPLVEK